MATKPRKLSPKPLTTADWPSLVRPGSRVFIGSSAAAPRALAASLFSGEVPLTDIEVIHLHTLGDAPWADPRFADTVRTNAFVLGPQLLDAVNDGRADYTPAFVFEVPALLRDRVLPVDVALIHVSPPDRKGNCTLGVSVDIVAAACARATHVVAQVNPRMPRTCGATQIPFARFTAYLEVDEELPEVPTRPSDKTLDVIGDYVAQLIDNGCTLRLGTSPIHHAIARALRGHRHLGIHSDVLGSPLHELIVAGAVDNSQKGPFNGRSIASFVAGNRALYDFVDGNKSVELHPSDCVNHPIAIAGNNRMVTVHSALQVDLSGQIVADSVGHRFQSGIGSQVDFIRGAALCVDGRPIIALPSTAPADGRSTIVATLDPGAGIVTSRGDVHYVVTEFGIATLRGRSIRERALELVQVAHPDHRADLLAIAKARKWVPVYEKLPASVVAGIGGIAVERLRLGDEPYILRPLQPSDERRMQEFFYSHTQETIQSRYGYMVSRMSRERAYELVNVDQSRDLALAILEVQGPREVIHAVGRYYLDPDGERAEVAFVTRETKRNCGMARALFERMRTIAKKRGLGALRAQVQPENAAMLGLFADYPHTLVPIDGASAIEVVMPIEP